MSAYFQFRYMWFYDPFNLNNRHFNLQFELDALDVNAVGFIDDTSNIIYSGSDNGIIKVDIEHVIQIDH